MTRALEAGVNLVILYFCPDFLGAEGQRVLERAQTKDVSVTELSGAAFKVLSYRERPGGIIAVAEKQEKRLADLTLPDDALVVVVEGLEKPGNLGALLRTADGVGAHALFTTGQGTDLENPNVVRSSMGSVFSLPSLAVKSSELLDWLQREQFSLVAATPHAETLYWDADFAGRTAVVLGAEHSGLSSEWLAVGQPVKIPMQGQADSLNVATAGALLLYEALRGRR